MNSICSICAQLKAVETSFYKYAAPEYDRPLPAAAALLVQVGDLGLVDAEKQHMRRCPECGTLYSYLFGYEYYVNGSEDEEQLTRLSADEARAYYRKQAKRLEDLRQSVSLYRHQAGSTVDYINHGNPSDAEARRAWQEVEDSERMEVEARRQLVAQIKAFRQTCPEILQFWSGAHIRACQAYLDDTAKDELDDQTASYVAKSGLEGWQRFLYGDDSFIQDYPEWLDGYRERVEQELIK